MTSERPEHSNGERPKPSEPRHAQDVWSDLPDSIREGFLAEAAMWRRVEALAAERAKPRGLLGLFGLRTSTGCY